ncbi:MAG: DUF1549 domain-containing protein [Planctomycetota bacterium]
MTAEQRQFFESKVRPLLVEHCQKCHGADKQRGGLQLNSLSAMLQGGDSGPAVVPGKPDESLLIEAIQFETLMMPPTGKLRDAEIDVLVRWVKEGAVWPAGETPSVAAPARTSGISDEDRKHWAFLPVRDPDLPDVANKSWGENGIDRFVLRKLEDEHLSPAPEADRRTLIRRVSYDLTGLPPTSTEVAEFLADDSPQAYSQMVDRLLDSPRYGEHWARHWLDLVRYAESDGFRADHYRPLAWRYRDYVIDSFNSDKPYDQFVTEQLAGDEVAPDDPAAVIATGYLRLYLYEYNQRDARTQWSDILNSITDNATDVFLGMSVGCARCHDHKFDPILQKDYYRLQAFFAPLLPRDDIAPVTAEQRLAYEAKFAEWERQTADLRGQIAVLEQPAFDRAAEGAVRRFPADIQEFMNKPADARLPFEKQIADLVDRQVRLDQQNIKHKDELREKLEGLKKQLAAISRPEAPALANSVTDVGPVAPITCIPGNRAQTPIEPGFLTVLDPTPAVIPPVTTSRAGATTGRRTALARWITDPTNPLSTRVIVNRVWQYYFGRGIASNPSDFGRLGGTPSHPELLDWMTTRFVKSGWSIKSLHRQILNSATYRQSATHPQAETQAQSDPANRWLWRSPVRRLQAEQIRDSLLLVSGELDQNMGGAPVAAAVPRRSIYTKFMRNSPDPFLAAFDVADGLNSMPERNVTTTSTQSLLMINGKWPLDRASKFSRRLTVAEPSDDGRRIDAAFRILLNRLPDTTERQLAFDFLYRERQRPLVVPLMPPLTVAFPAGGGQAIDLQPGRAPDMLSAPMNPSLPEGDFTVEARIVLRSIHPNADVSTIAAHWDGNTSHAGWSLGVTSAKSGYHPRNLILQLVGGDATGNRRYEVVASNLHLELGKPYSVAASVRISDTSDNGITFYLKDLSDPAAETKVVKVPHQVTGSFRSQVPWTIGGRHAVRNHKWDGLIDAVRLSTVALTSDQMQKHDGTPGVIGDWLFEKEPGVFQDQTAGSRAAYHLSSVEALDPGSVSVAAWKNLCHILLNSNEFLYVD